MTKDQPVRQRRELDPKPDRVLASSNELTSEEEAIRAGVLAGDAALARFGSSGVLVLFVDRGRSANWAPRLEVLRTYAELRRALLQQGTDIPASSLVTAGYTAAEIVRFNAAIAATPSSLGPTSETCIFPMPTENAL